MWSFDSLLYISQDHAVHDHNAVFGAIARDQKALEQHISEIEES